MIKTVVKQEQKVVDVRKHYLDDKVAKEIALGLLSDELELMEFEIDRSYNPYFINLGHTVMDESIKVILKVKGYIVTIERG